MYMYMYVCIYIYIVIDIHAMCTGVFFVSEPANIKAVAGYPRLATLVHKVVPCRYIYLP